eukprot:jgi/Mesvir1/19299/Mv25058-RA.1
MALVFTQHDYSQMDSSFLGSAMYGERNGMVQLPSIKLAEMPRAENLWRQPPAEVASPCYPYDMQDVTYLETTASPTRTVPFGGFEGRSGSHGSMSVTLMEPSPPKHWIEARMRRCGANEPAISPACTQEDAASPSTITPLKNPSLLADTRSPQHWIDARICSPNRRGKAHGAGLSTSIRRSKSCQAFTEFATVSPAKVSSPTVPPAEVSSPTVTAAEGSSPTVTPAEGSSPTPQGYSWWKLRSHTRRSTSGGRPSGDTEADVASSRPCAVPVSVEGMLFFSEISRSSILCPQAASAAASWHTEVPRDDLSGMHVKPPPKPENASFNTGDPSPPSSIRKLSLSLGRPAINLLTKDFPGKQRRRSTSLALCGTQGVSEGYVDAKLHPFINKLPQLI